MELERFENYPWGRVAFKVLMDSVKGIDISGCYTINGFAQALQVWVYTALPELGATFGNSLPNNPSPPILAYKGRKGRRQFKEAILSQTRVINFIQKDTGEMFPKWEFDVEDPLAENIIKLMFVKKPWKWTMDCWEVTGTWVNTKPAVVSPAKKNVVKEDIPRPQKKARKEAPAEASEEAAAEASEEAAAEASEEVTTTVGGLTKEDIKTMFKDIADAMREGFGTCLKEIKYLSERVEAVEKKVGITTKRKGKSSQNTTSPPKPTLEPRVSNKSSPNKEKSDIKTYQNAQIYYERETSSEDFHEVQTTSRKSRRLPGSPDGFQEVQTASRKSRRLKWKSSSALYYRRLTYDLLVSRLHIDAFNVLRKRYDANPQHFRSERMCFLDHLFAQQWRFNFKDFKDSKPDHNGLGRLPGGAWNYYAGTIPSFCQSNKVLGTDIDDIYAPVNFADSHWIAMWISIPKTHIIVFDSICSSISPEELDVVMEPFLYMVPYLLVECASSDELHAQYSLETFTYERPTNIPPARAGDCGVYTLKYIECHALGIEFSKKDFAKPNGKSMRDKMAVDIFQENKDMDDILGILTEDLQLSRLMDDLIEGLLDDLIEGLLDDLIEGLLDDLIEGLLDDLIEGLLDDLIEGLLDDLIEGLLDDLIEGLLDDLIEGLLDDLIEGLLDDLIEGLLED
uniref:Ubiquitin-like protease family profile domain-containing protein n=1 Tax=Brassica oleracea var. oleracea TaxID=109376 RepID=A0A0D3CM73_BRAOL